MNSVLSKHHYILFLGILGSCVLLNSVLPFYLMLFYLILGNILLLSFNKLKSDEIKIFNISFSLGIFFLFILDDSITVYSDYYTSFIILFGLQLIQPFRFIKSNHSSTEYLLPKN